MTKLEAILSMHEAGDSWQAIAAALSVCSVRVRYVIKHGRYGRSRRLQSPQDLEGEKLTGMVARMPVAFEGPLVAIL
jgi:hypothetical protein